MIGRLLGCPAVWLTGLPLLASLPQILGVLHASPMLRTAWLAYHLGGSWVPSIWSVLDPNDGSTNQALGHLAALDWLHGVVPWWNPYSGVGLPLAAEYQPAAFLPLTLLQALPSGMLWQHILLQIIGAWGAYLLLRQLGLGRFAATCGGVIFGFNGTVAWFNHAPALPVPFLPWMILGVERIYAGGGRAWVLFAAALALAVLAGFPETAFIEGLFVLVWAVLRLVQTAPARWPAYLGGLALGGIVGLALCAPQLLAFADFLPHAEISIHGGLLAHWSLGPPSLVPALIAPYFYGPIYAFIAQWPALIGIEGNTGGCVTLALLGMAVYGLIARRGALSWMLAGWTVLALLKAFGVQPFVALWNLVPGITATAFYRYAEPTWELAITVLAAFGLDALTSPMERGGPNRLAWRAAAAAGALMFACALGFFLALRHQLHVSRTLYSWSLASLLWAGCTTACLLIVLRWSASAKAGRIAGLMLAAEAMIVAMIPGFSNPGRADWDRQGIRYLREHLGLARFFTLGPVQPNYSAYFGIASINHNYLPVAKRWTDWVKAHLDPDAEAVTFNGLSPPGLPPKAEVLRRNLAEYEWTGVRYVVAPENMPLALGAGVAPVYADRLMRIYELPHPAPYFEILSGDCAPSAPDGRTALSVSCRTPGVLLRRELFFPGWSAWVNARPVPIAAYRGLFQSILLSVGQNRVGFSYAPPHAALGWSVMGAGTAALLLGLWSAGAASRRERREREEGRTVP